MFTPDISWCVGEYIYYLFPLYSPDTFGPIRVIHILLENITSNKLIPYFPSAPRLLKSIFYVYKH